ncbi:MAG: gliding motility-associated C-terminal domain-containing protein, partial [Bacteroidota bacterium]|nr:gliding motility-associated C-terminal domain-containing protein [Bacteroidota bacterium]
CQDSATFFVSDTVPLLTLLLDSLVDISCNSVDDGQIAVSGSGGTGPYTYEWISGASGNDSSLTNLSGVTYEVVLTDNNGCDDTASYTITNPDALAVNKNTTDVVCFGASTGTFSAVFSGGTPPYTINYTSGFGVIDSTTADGLYVSSLSSGTYSFSVTDANSCLLEESVTIIDSNPEISLSFINVAEETCNNDNGGATVQASGGVPNYTYNWSNGATASTINMLPGGIDYSVTVTDNLGCTKDSTVFVPIIDAVFIESILVADNLCYGDTLGSLTIETSGVGLPHTFTYTHLGNSTTVVSNDTITVINTLPSGSYTLSVQDVSTCVNTWSSPIDIAESTTLTVSVDAQNSTSTLDCHGDNDGKIFLNISGANPFPGDYYWLFVNAPDFSQNLTVDSVVGLSAGTYDLTVQDANGCSFSTPYEIVEPLPLSTSHVVTNNTCFDDSDGEALVIVSGGTAGFTLSSTTFSNSNITQLSTDTFRITALSEGTYFYDVVDDSGCQLLNSTFYVGEPALLEIVDVTSTLESCLGYDATATVSVTGGVGGYSYFWTSDNNNSTALVLQDGITQNPSVNNSTAQNVSNGWVYVFVKDANSCNTTDSIFVSQSTSPQLQIVGIVDNLCDGDSAGQISLNAIDGTPFYEYSINGGANWQFLATFSDLADGTYSVTVRDSLGCQDIISNIDISSPSPISVTVSTQQVSCFGDSDGNASVVDVSGGTSSNGTYNFSWQNDQGTNLWPGNSSGINSTVTNLVPGTYQLEVKDDNGCTTLYTPVVIGQPLEVSVDLAVISDYNGVDIRCFGDSNAVIQANASGGTGLFTFEWFDSDGIILDESVLSSYTFDTLSNVSQGTYSIVVTDSLGCPASNSISVTHPSQIVVDFENVVNIRCDGNNDGQATALYSGGLGFGNYNVVWTDSTNTVISLIAQASQLSVGSYVATYTDNNGCAGQDTITINYSELFKINNPNDTTSVSCFGSIDGSFNFNVTGGWLPYTYVWNDPLGQQSPTAVGLAPNQWYTNIITDANNCILIDSVFVTSPIDEVEVSTISTVDNDCYENSIGKINVQVSGGSPPYIFDWSGPNGYNSSSTISPNISTLSSGNYSLVVTDDNGCEKTLVEHVDGPDSPLQINSVNTVNVSCFGLNDGTANLLGQVVGGTPISDPPFYFENWLGENPETLTAGTYSVEVSDSAGCKTSVSFTISEPEALSTNIDVIDAYCQDETGKILTHVTGGTPFNNTGLYQYEIEPLSAISPFFSYQESSKDSAEIVVEFPQNNNQADTLFLLTITDANDCQITQTVEIHPARLFYNSETVQVCSSDTISILANRFNDYDSYLWSINPDQPFVDNGSDIEIVVNNSMSITVTAYEPSSACLFTDDLEIVELKPSIELDNTDVGILLGESVSLSITSGEEPYLWSTGEMTSSINVNPLLTTNYVAFALDTATQCIGNDTVRVFVGMNEGFSPNGDGYNDNWKIDYLNQYESLQVEIFNRWGASLWKAQSPNITNWDGNYNGKELPVGTYYYIINFDVSSNNEPITGPVTIVR